MMKCHSPSTPPSSVQVLYGVNQRVRTEDVDSPLCEIRPVQSVQLVVMTGDRGLCGGYNNFILKKVRVGVGVLVFTQPFTCACSRGACFYNSSTGYCA